MIICFETGGDNPFMSAKTKSLITLLQREYGGMRFDVVYGLQSDKNLTYNEACTKLGQAILHDACRNGLASNEGA